MSPIQILIVPYSQELILLRTYSLCLERHVFVLVVVPVLVCSRPFTTYLGVSGHFTMQP
jgi:hypothetical protein